MTKSTTIQQEEGMNEPNVFYAEEESDGTGALVWGIAIFSFELFFALGCVAGYILRGCM